MPSALRNQMHRSLFSTPEIVWMERWNSRINESVYCHQRYIGKIESFRAYFLTYTIGNNNAIDPSFAQKIYTMSQIVIEPNAACKKQKTILLANYSFNTMNYSCGKYFCNIKSKKTDNPRALCSKSTGGRVGFVTELFNCLKYSLSCYLAYRTFSAKRMAHRRNRYSCMFCDISNRYH